jgi:hypothetical protein
MKALLLTLAVLLNFTFASAQSDEQITIKTGQQRVTKTGRITIKFLELVEDSRCPADVNCVWAGIAKIKIQLNKNGKTAVVELNTQNEKSTVFQGHTVTLKDLQPRQSTTSKYSPSAYSATLTITKK